MLGSITTVALSIRTDGTYAPFSMDAWAYAGQMTLLGMLMIFAVLGLLWGVLAIFKLVFARKKKMSVPAAHIPLMQISPLVAEEEPVQDSNDDAALVAIITAAVAAYIEDSDEPVPSGGFRVVSYKREKGGRAWNSK